MLEKIKKAFTKTKSKPKTKKEDKPLVLKQEVQKAETKKDTVSETKSSLTFGN
jgi:hypothetical protein